MEQLAEPGKAYLTAAHRGAGGGLPRARRISASSRSRARAGRCAVHELTGVGAARGRLDVSRARGFSQFVGRDEELRILESGAGRVGRRAAAGDRDRRRGRGRQEPALRRCSRERCRARGMPVYHTAGQAHATSIPLLPVLHIMRSYFDVTDLDSDQTARERIAGKLLLLDERFADDLPVLFEFLGVPDPERPSPRMDPEARQRRVLDITKRLVHAQSARVPGVSVFEDLHWLDSGSEVFVANHLDAIAGRPRADHPQLPPGVPRGLDVEVLLPADRAGTAGPRGRRSTARGPARLRPFADGLGELDLRAHRRQPVLHRGGRAVARRGREPRGRARRVPARPARRRRRGARERAGGACRPDRPARRTGEGRPAGGGRDRQGVPRAGPRSRGRAGAVCARGRARTSWSSASSCSSRSSTPTRCTRSSIR